MQQGKQVIEKYKKRWQVLQVATVSLYALGTSVLCWFVTGHILASILVFLVTFSIAFILIKPWILNLEYVGSYIDRSLDTAEDSSSLLLTSSQNLSGLASLQRQKVVSRLESQLSKLHPKTDIKRASITALTLLVVGVVLFQLGVRDRLFSNPQPNDVKQVMTFQVSDSIAPTYKIPVLKSQRLTITYPNYTRKSTTATSDMNVKAVEGSRLSWELTFDGNVTTVTVEGIDEDQDLKKGASSFSKTVIPSSSGYYNFRFSDSLGTSYVSELYAIELTRDEAPNIEIKEIPQFSSFEATDDKNLIFKTNITDDFGVATAQIIATVSKGSGESVKFREEKLAFDQTISVGQKSVRLSKTINLNQLKMESGDELYFYIEATDLKTPRPNVARSETYFAVIKDTITDDFAIDGTLGADLMPDYFRSQRQLIIDTEKLIAERSQYTEPDFKSESNDLGFDQKALRLKYGQFMGDEDDSGIATQVDLPEEAHNPDDPTAGFRHDHDTENEHNLVEHENEEGEEEEESPIEKYMHNHDDPEEATLFTESLRSKLQQAMAEMWDAELHLRLATPEKSLPYQYKALKLIQEIKNSARIYVHRIGFDPPPIKEDKRLSGDLDEVANFYKKETLESEDRYAFMRQSISILEERIYDNGKLRVEDKAAFAKAGEELAILAISEPGKYLKTLQQLKRLTEEKSQPIDVWKTVQRGLLMALPVRENQPTARSSYTSELEKIVRKELQASDR